MAKTIKINGVTYSNVPSVEIPLADNSGNASFKDLPALTSAATTADILEGKEAINGSGEKMTGSLSLNISTTTPTDITGVLYGNGSTVSGKSFGGASGVATLDSDSKLTPAQITTKDIEVTSSISLLPAHNNRRLRCNNSGAITITIQPQNGTTYNYVTEHETEIKSVNTGQVTLALGSGVSVKAVTPANLKIAVGGACVLHRGAANVWDLDGALEA